MTGAPVKAHQIASISGARSSDGQFGLIQFVRDKPMDDGQTDLWVAVPNKLLPYLASVAVKQLPQPETTGGRHNIPHALAAKQVAVGVAPDGQVILSLMIERGAALSYRLDPTQARQVLDMLRSALGDEPPSVPPTTKAPPRKPRKK